MIISYCMIENCTELAVNGFKVSRGIHFPILSLIGKKLILPCNHIFWLNLCNLTLPEIRKYLGTDNMAFGLPCVFLYPFFLVGFINLKEAGKSHIQLGLTF